MCDLTVYICDVVDMGPWADQGHKSVVPEVNCELISCFLYMNRSIVVCCQFSITASFLVYTDTQYSVRLHSFLMLLFETDIDYTSRRTLIGLQKHPLNRSAVLKA